MVKHSFSNRKRIAITATLIASILSTATATDGAFRQENEISDTQQFVIPGNSTSTTIETIWERDLNYGLGNGGPADDPNQNAISIATVNNILYVCIAYYDDISSDNRKNKLFLRRYDLSTGEELENSIIELPTAFKGQKDRLIITSDESGHILTISMDYNTSGLKNNIYISTFDPSEIGIYNNLFLKTDLLQLSEPYSWDSTQPLTNILEVTGNALDDYAIKFVISQTNEKRPDYYFTNIWNFKTGYNGTMIAAKRSPLLDQNEETLFYHKNNYLTANQISESKLVAQISEEKPLLFSFAENSFCQIGSWESTWGTGQESETESTAPIHGINTFKYGNHNLVVYPATYNSTDGATFKIAKWDEYSSFNNMQFCTQLPSNPFPTIDPTKIYHYFRQFAWTEEATDINGNPSAYLYLYIPGSGMGKYYISDTANQAPTSIGNNYTDDPVSIQLHGRELSVSSNSGTTQLQIVDITGTIVYDCTLNSDSTVDLSHLSPAIYLIKTNDSVRKIILQ